MIGFKEDLNFEASQLHQKAIFEVAVVLSRLKMEIKDVSPKPETEKDENR
jgi:hypothetical protein